MIRSFRNKGLAELWSTGRSSRVDARLAARILRRLDALHDADRVEAMAAPGFNFHTLHGFTPTRYTIHVNGPWCITFAFEQGDAFDVDFEQYH